jgi:phosphatidylglycerophosphatase A
VKRLDEPNLAAIFLGISLGVALGSIPIFIPNVPVPVKLGLAGGPLIVSILISKFGPQMKLVTYTTSSANKMIRQIGITLFLILFFTITGIHSTNKVEQIWGEDPSKVVIDEMVGVWIALLAAPQGNIGYAIVAFILFRLFDIFKPLGIRKMEDFKGGIGVMMDDILAGIYSFVLLIGARWLIG